MPTHVVALRGGDAGVRQTVGLLSRLVAEAVVQPEVQKEAWSVTFSLPQTDRRGQAEALLRRVQSYRWRPDPEGVELVYAPKHVIAMQAGDCDELAMTLAALYAVAGFPTRWVVVSNEPTKDFNHILVEVEVDGVWHAADPSRMPGDRAPAFGEIIGPITRTWRAPTLGRGAPTLRGRIRGLWGRN